MTGLLTRATAWLVEPRDDEPPAEARHDERRLYVPPATDAPNQRPRRFAPPVARRTADPDTIHRATAEGGGHPGLAALRTAPPSAPERPGIERPGTAPPPLVVPRAVALGPEPDLPALAAALALTLRRPVRAPAALVALWRSQASTDAHPRPPAAALATPGLPGARIVAARLTRRGLAASAHGRLVWIALPADATDTLAALDRAEAAAGDMPSVLAILGPREPTADALIAGRAPIVVAAEPGAALVALVAEDLGIRVHSWTPPPGAARLATVAGVRAPSDGPLAHLAAAEETAR